MRDGNSFPSVVCVFSGNFGVRKYSAMQGFGVGVVGSRRFLDGVGVRIVRVLGVGVGIFDPTPTPKVQLN